VAALVVLSPWAARNYVVLGSPILFRDCLGIAVYVSNNDRAESSLVRIAHDGVFAALHPNTSLREASDLKRLGEVEYNRDRLHKALAWARANPHRFVLLTLERIREFWFPAPEDPPFHIPVRIVTVLSFAGLALMARQRPAAALVLATAALLTAVPYYFVHSSVRFRLQILWLSVLPAGYLVFQLWEALRMALRRRTGATAGL
jgi:hypothetical protein